MPVTERVDSPSIEELTVYPLNRMELRMAESGVKGRSAAERDAVAEMVRTRGAAYAARFRHATELSWRMPEMYWTAQDDGRMTIDHMDAIWRRLDRHPALRARIDRDEAEVRRIEAERGATDGAESGTDDGPSREYTGDEGYRHYVDDPWQRGRSRWEERFPEPENSYCPSADHAVEFAVVEWLRSSPHRLITVSGSGSLMPRSTVTIHRLRELVDTAVDEDIEQREKFEAEEREQGTTQPVPFNAPY
ncbi:MAG: hypothetical protein ACTH1D_04315 [Mycobacteriaceae bacterium]|uniref:hypothetical protein n=1 Tax=Corynebacterium sp. TaxID=1720 RepID=UPI003F99BE77